MRKNIRTEWGITGVHKYYIYLYTEGWFTLNANNFQLKQLEISGWMRSMSIRAHPSTDLMMMMMVMMINSCLRQNN